MLYARILGLSRSGALPFLLDCPLKGYVQYGRGHDSRRRLAFYAAIVNGTERELIRMEGNSSA
jgi:hypothetical protein